MIQLKDILREIPDIQSLDVQEKQEYSAEITILLEKTKELLVIRDKYADILKKESELSQEVVELKSRLFPSIYFGVAKHHTTKEPYIIARNLWKKGKNDYAQLSAYVGSLSKFPKGLEDPEAKKIASHKIRKKIREKFPL